MNLRRCKAINPLQFRNVLDSSSTSIEPFIVKNVCSDWIATKNRLNIDGLKKRISNQKIQVNVETIGHYMNPNMKLIQMSFYDLLDYYLKQSNNTQKSHVYLAQQDLSDIGDLINDIMIPPFINNNKDNLYGIKLWLCGLHGSTSPCHYDSTHNILCQVFGVKHVILFPPDEGKLLYPAFGTSRKNTSRIDFDLLEPSFFESLQQHTDTTDSNPTSSSQSPIINTTRNLRNIETATYDDNNDIILGVNHQLLTRYPSLKHSTTAIIATIHSGDGLFIPLKYWHYCTAKSSSCSVNFWWL